MSIFINPNSVLANGHTGVVDVRKGGQQGLKRDPDFWFHNSLYVKQKLIPILIAEPQGFRWLDDGAFLAQSLKSLVELHCTSITGLNQTITNTFDEKVLNHDPNNVMQTPTLSSRERTTPALAFPELDGKPVTKLFRYWSEMLIMDTESGVPGVAGLPRYIREGSPHITPRDRSMTMMFIEPTANRLDVNSVYMVTNMMPESIPDEITSEKGAEGESPLIEITFSGTTTVKNLEAFARAYLASLNKTGYLPTALGKFEDEFSPNISDSVTNTYRTGVTDAANSIE